MSDYGASAAHFRQFLEAGWEGIQGLVGSEFETEHIEFKRKDDPSTGKENGRDQSSYSKALSGFANASGGVLVWGVYATEEDGQDIVQEIFPISSPSVFASRLRTLAPSLVSKSVDGVEVEVIANPGEPDEGIVVVHIPYSSRAPHMAVKGRRYYRRVGHSFLPMQHYEVADQFGRRPQPDLRVDIGLRMRPAYTDGPTLKVAGLELTAVFRNRGKAIARFPAFSMTRPPEWETRGHSFVGSPALTERHAPDRWWKRWTGGADQVVYPDDLLTVANVTFKATAADAPFPELRFRFSAVADRCPPISRTIWATTDNITSAWKKIYTGYEEARIPIEEQED